MDQPHASQETSPQSFPREREPRSPEIESPLESIRGRVRALSEDSDSSACERRAALSELCLIEADLSDLNLSGVDFSELDLSRANFKGAELVGANFLGANLFGARLSEADLSEANLDNADLSSSEAVRTQFSRASLVGASIIDAELSAAKFHEADLSRADLRRSRLNEAELCNANAKNARFTDALIIGANFKHCLISGACFDEADLRESRLRGVVGFQDASWTATDIRGVDFTGAHMCRRWILDHNFLVEFRSRNRWSQVVYWIWSATSDCGRSLTRWSLCTLVIACFFAAIYTQLDVAWGEHSSPLSSIYFSIVTLTALGYGDIVPLSAAAKVVTMIEVMSGYVMLGGLLSIFNNKMARRAD